MSTSSEEGISDLSLLYSRSEIKTKCLFSRYLQPLATQVPYVCVLILTEAVLNSYSENLTNLLFHIFDRIFFVARMQQNRKVCSAPSSVKLKEWDYITSPYQQCCKRVKVNIAN